MTDELPDAELEVLAILWNLGECTAREVREALGARRPMSHGATFTLLTRLEEKGYVARTGRKVGKAFVYRAAVRPTRTYRHRVADLVERLFGGDPVRLVSSLFETQPPGPEELQRLQRLLDELRERQDGGER